MSPASMRVLPLEQAHGRLRMNEIDLEVTCATDDKANALVRAMLAAGLAQKL